MNIWITGATGGIGSAVVRALAGHDRFPMGASSDVQDKMELEEYITSWAMEVDALVYCAGRNHLDWSKNMSTIEFNMTYDVNVTGLLRCLQVSPEIKKCVVIGSDAAHRPMRTSAAYNASKAALEALVKVIARERAQDLQINLVAPGLIDGTDMTDYVELRTRELRPELDLMDYMLSGIPMGRAGQPEEVAEVVRWLIEDAPAYLNGSIIEINGGR